ncbi:MAG: ATP-dependent DNA helicase [Brachymonas denitrificans]
MALAVARAIAGHDALVVEAGTGVGKTFAYLVPALLAGERVLVSTATKTLQDQLFTRDLPYLANLLGLPLRLALLKGRGSYLCLHRLQQARHSVLRSDGVLLHTISRIERFAQVTRTGDLSELEGLDERSPAIPLVTSTRENCLGSSCEHFRQCHVNVARREALAADVVVVNHHLFFADLAVRESGMAELLPSVHTVIFDEAHQLNEIGTQFMGMQLGSSHLLDLCRDMLATGMQSARGLADWQTLARQLEHAVRELRLVVGQRPAGTKLRWTEPVPDTLNPDEWPGALRAVRAALEDAAASLDMMSELGPDFVRLHQRATSMQERIDLFQQPCPPDAVRWVDVSAQLRLVQSPLDIAETVRTRMLKRGASIKQDSAWDEVEKNHEELPVRQDRAWIFTSATLGDEPQLRWFTEPCGMGDVATLQVESPFAYATHAGVHVPGDFPLPNAPDHPAAVAGLVADAAGQLGGRTLVLTTTLRSLRLIGEALRRHFEGKDSIEVLVQGESTKRRLIERFRQGDDEGRLPGCILVASASFWEGVDVPGDGLQLVVIDKLPFPPPQDPLVEARSRRLELEGRSPFRDYFLPETAVMLKQGAGRLIRRENDTGVLVVCDRRLLQMSYGKRLLKALPPMRLLASRAELDAVLQELACRHGQD